MLYKALADCVLIIHFTFILFVVSGGLFVLKWRRLAVVHIPCAVWGALIEFTGWICPLTRLEVELREAAGAAGYRGGFIDHYLLSIIYPYGLTRQEQVLLGLIVITINLGLYVLVALRGHRSAS